jgi:tetratricopeptide (TPR) repeat protein
VLLALEMMPTTLAAESIILEHLKAKPQNNTVRMMYARALASSQRYGDAVTQLEAVTRSDPKLGAPWLTLGALYLELHQPKQATAALERYVQIAQTEPAKAAADPQVVLDDDETPLTSDRGLTQAWLMLAQAAEQQNDFKRAEAWLKKVDNPQRALEVVQRRASLMARQGKLREARELIQRSPEKTEDDARAKTLAEVQILRDTKHWSDADNVLAQANKKFPDDVDLLYEQSMMAEKLNRMDEMERLLRRVIELKPDHHHAYNALGYSLAERNVRLPEAKSLIQKALEIAPGEPFITDSLGWVEYRIGNREEALRLLRGAYQSRPDPEIAAHLGEVLWVSGQRDEARRIWREGRSKDSANDVLRETLARLRVGDL